MIKCKFFKNGEPILQKIVSNSGAFNFCSNPLIRIERFIDETGIDFALLDPRFPASPPNRLSYPLREQTMRTSV
jgi:hypothetical protein